MRWEVSSAVAPMTRIVVIGATGDVGRGIVRDALDRGWSVDAVARNAAGLGRLAGDLGAPPALRTVPGSIADEPNADALLRRIPMARVDAVVTTVNSPWTPRPIMETTSADLEATLATNLLPHLMAARTFIPALPAGGVYLGLGGGMADAVFTARGPISMTQAAQRMLFRSLAKENSHRPVHVRELIVASMVNGESTRERADPSWLTDRQVGARVCEIITKPSAYPGPIVTMTPAAPAS